MLHRLPAMELVGVGIAVIDVIQEVDTFPEEDSKIRALSSRKTRGGNVTNALVISAQLGCHCHWIGTTTDPRKDADAAFAHGDLAAFGVDTSTASVLPTGSMPVSYILASSATGSRTIIHHRDLPELTVEAFCDSLMNLRKRRDHPARTPLWIHFEGRNLDNVAKMMRSVRSGDVEGAGDGNVISLEVEALRNEWEHIKPLLKLVDVAFVSKDYIRKKLQFTSATAFFRLLRDLWEDEWRPRAVICPWGEDGVFYMDVLTGKTEHHVATTALKRAIDSVGAGDSFIGATLAALTHGSPLEKAVRLACRVATAKCGQQGFRLPVALQNQVISELN